MPPSATRRSPSSPTTCAAIPSISRSPRVATRWATAPRSSSGATGAFWPRAAAIVLLVGSMIGFYTARLSAERDRARLAAAPVIEGQRAADRPADERGPVPDAGSRRADAQLPLDIGARRIDSELAGEPELQARDVDGDRPHVPAHGPARQGAAAARTRAGDWTQRLRVGARHGRAEPERPRRAASRAGQPREGRAAARESLALRRRLLGPEDKDVAVTLVELARVLRDSGRSDEAEPRFASRWRFGARCSAKSIARRRRARPSWAGC